MEPSSFWARVKQQIKAHRYSQKKLAEYIGVPTSKFFSEEAS